MYKEAKMERENVIGDLRSCLISIKGGCKIEDLNRDYRIVVDENIPFRKLGYSTLYDFLKTIPSIRLVKRGADCYVEAIPTKESLHLAKLVAHQKTASKKNRSKTANGRKMTPFRQPYTRKKSNYSTRFGNNSCSVAASVGRQYMSPPVPLMSSRLPNIHSNDRPRFMHGHSSGAPPPSPSNRMMERQNANSMLPKSQSISKPKEDSHYKNTEREAAPVINQKPKTVNNNNSEYPSKHKVDLSQRIVNNRIIASTTESPSSIQHSVQSVILSPLTPAQLLSGGYYIRQLQASQNPPQPLMKPVTRTVPRPQPSQPLGPREELSARAKQLGLPEPVYTFLPTKMKNANESAVYAKVMIGQHHGYASYPAEARTEVEAQEIAARIALADLEKEYDKTTLTKTVNTDLIKERILEIVNKHANGIFMHEMPRFYKETFEEALPENWQAIIKEYPLIVLEKGVNNSIILRRFAPSTNNMLQETPTTVHSNNNAKVDKIQLHSIGPVAPGQLELPTSAYWMVVVNCVISSTQIWVRLADDYYTEQLEAMTIELTNYLDALQHPIKPSTIEVGSYYAVNQDESWHRVCCLDYNKETELATVLFIDLGDEDTFECSKLHVLDKRFCLLAAQAFRVNLVDLHEFSDCASAVSLIEQVLLSRAFYVEVVNRDAVIDDVQCPSVIFYDTSGPEDINLNAVILKQIEKQILTVPNLITEGHVSKVLLSHVDHNGDVYVQVQSDSMVILVKLLNKLINSGPVSEDFKNSLVISVESDKIYFVMVEGNWYRGKVVSFDSQDELRVFLVDFGKTVSTKRTSLLSLEKLSKILSVYPHQALKVHLHNIDNSKFNEKMADQLTELAPKEESILLKAVGSKNGVPIVELFKRIHPSNMLVSINNTLALDEHRRVQDDGNNNAKVVRKRVERMNSKTSNYESDDMVKILKPPKIAPLNTYFDVHVTMAAHPGNFTIQPFSDQSRLEKMMFQLQDACCSYNGPLPTPESVKEGKLYAAKHMDGRWYRVYVTSIIREGMVSVYFCDFGDASVLPFFNLQPLKSQFLELPYQAIKAKLVGIRPINVDWSVEDSVRFQELVVQKNFVSIVVETDTDPNSPGDTVLGLKLIDVNSVEDIYIDQLLVDEKRAVVVN